MFRGFVLAQVYACLRERSGHDRSAPVAKAAVIAAILFALEHIPNRIMKDYPVADLLGDQVGVFLIGLLWTWMYLRTGNLFFVVGAHALHNYPTLILEMPGATNLPRFRQRCWPSSSRFFGPDFFQPGKSDLTRAPDHPDRNRHCPWRYACSRSSLQAECYSILEHRACNASAFHCELCCSVALLSLSCLAAAGAGWCTEKNFP